MVLVQVEDSEEVLEEEVAAEEPQEEVEDNTNKKERVKI